MQTKTWAALAVGVVAGIAIDRMFYHSSLQPQIIVEIPEITIEQPAPPEPEPVVQPRMREVNRNPQKYGRGKIF